MVDCWCWLRWHRAANPRSQAAHSAELSCKLTSTRPPALLFLTAHRDVRISRRAGNSPERGLRIFAQGVSTPWRWPPPPLSRKWRTEPACRTAHSCGAGAEHAVVRCRLSGCPIHKGVAVGNFWLQYPAASSSSSSSSNAGSQRAAQRSDRSHRRPSGRAMDASHASHEWLILG